MVILTIYHFCTLNLDALPRKKLSSIFSFAPSHISSCFTSAEAIQQHPRHPSEGCHAELSLPLNTRAVVCSVGHAASGRRRGWSSSMGFSSALSSWRRRRVAAVASLPALSVRHRRASSCGELTGSGRPSSSRQQMILNNPDCRSRCVRDIGRCRYGDGGGRSGSLAE